MADDPRRRVAVFDVDGTLLAADTLWLAACHSLSPVGLGLAAAACLPWLIGWQLRLIPTSRVKQRTLAAFRVCEQVNREEACGRGDWLLPTLISRLNPEAEQRLRWHQRQGDRVVLCSASPRMLLQPLADWLGVELVCTELRRVEGVWRPWLAGPNCKGPEKVRRLVEHLGPLETWRLESYGDSQGDRELLQAAAMPHYRSFGPETRPYPPFQLNTLLPVVGLGFLSYGLLGFASQREQLLPLLHQLSNPIMLGLLVVLLSYAMRFGRWRLLLGSLHEPPPLAADSRIWMGSFAFTATPGKTGESVRALLLHQECGIPAALTLVALVVERVTDALAVLLIVLINLPLMLRLGMAVTFPLSLALLVLAAGWWLAQRATMRIQVRTMIHHLLRGRHATAGDQGLAALRQLLRPPLLLQATLIGTVAWSLEGFALWLLLRGMGIGNATLGGATIAHTGAGLIGAISLLPGGLGTTEASTVGLLVIQGIGLAAASSATLLIRLMTLWFATALGVLCLLSSKR